jgi:L-histidine Nalpha-methyltransferase / hercynylcysteine S-oxide synthase
MGQTLIMIKLLVSFPLTDITSLYRALRKTSHILLGLSHLVSGPLTVTAPITYYALDLEKRELERTLSQLAMSKVGSELKGKVETKGICATYDGGLKFIEEGGLQGRDVPNNISESHGRSEHYTLSLSGRDSSPGSSSSRSAGTETDTTAPSTPEVSQAPLHILFLGSSHGNFNRNEGSAFLRSLPLRPGSGDTLLIGLDHDNGREKIEEAYNDKKGVSRIIILEYPSGLYFVQITRQFIMNGLKAAGRTLGNENMFQADKWEYVNRYNTELRMSIVYSFELLSHNYVRLS